LDRIAGPLETIRHRNPINGKLVEGHVKQHQKAAIELDPPEPRVVAGSFDDFDVFHETTRGWDLQTALLKPGGFSADVFQFVDPVNAFQFGRIQFRATLRQSGSPPLKLLTFVVPTRLDFSMDWRRQTVTGHDLAVFPVGGELHAHVRSDFDVRLVSFPIDLVLQTADLLGYPDFGEALRRQEVFRCNPNDLVPIRRSLQDVEKAANRRPPSVSKRLRLCVLEYAISVIANSQSDGVRARSRLRDVAVRRAEDYVIAHAASAPTVANLCMLTGASERSLQTAFKERFGVSPKTFINAVRLNGVRRELRTAARVGDVANRWGFWHMGQFAADYKRMFLELPSETLDRVRRDSGTGRLSGF